MPVHEPPPIAFAVPGTAFVGATASAAPLNPQPSPQTLDPVHQILHLLEPAASPQACVGEDAVVAAEEAAVVAFGCCYCYPALL